MGSWVSVSEAAELDEMGAPWPAHAIQCDSKWAGQERHTHERLAEVQGCWQARRDEDKGIEVWPCSWHLLGHYDDGSTYEYPCEAPTRYTDDKGSYECDRGHHHIALEVQWQQGIVYTDDPLEAKTLAGQGLQVLAMNGGAAQL